MKKKQKIVKKYKMDYMLAYNTATKQHIIISLKTNRIIGSCEDYEIEQIVNSSSKPAVYENAAGQC